MSETNPMADLVGPLYSQDAVADWLGCTVADLAVRAAVGELLAVETSDNVEIFPVFQFTSDRSTVRPELIPALRAFAECDPWFVGVWLRSPKDDLDDTSPDEWLATRGDPGLFRLLAGRRAAIMSA